MTRFVGGHRAAERLTDRVGATVTKDIVERLADAGHLSEMGSFRGWPLWDPAAIDALDARVVVDAVEAWRTLTTPEAVARLGIRPVDFEHLAQADVIAPAQTVTTQWGTPARLWLTRDLDQLGARDDIDLAALQRLGPGSRSGLARLTPARPRRSRIIRRAVDRLAGELGVEMWCRWDRARRRWEIDTDPISPAVDEAITADADLAPWADDITVGTPAGAATRWARRMLTPGQAVIFDCETTCLDGLIVEVAVIDAATGEVLVDTLINPGEPITPQTQAVHGISDTDVDAAPPLGEVLPGLLDATKDRTIVAYNADFDYDRLVTHCTRDRLDPAHLTKPDQWACAMDQRSAWLDLDWWVPLNGGHRALADCQAVRELLHTMSTHPSGVDL